MSSILNRLQYIMQNDTDDHLNMIRNHLDEELLDDTLSEPNLETSRNVKIPDDPQIT